MLRPKQSRRRLITASCSVLIIRGTDCFLMFKNSASLSNVVKYNKEHGKIMLRCREISTEGDTVVFEFTCRDTGIGMSREFQEHLFEPFTQERVGGHSKYGSTGLGMSITMGLVKRMGGDITFESEKDKGTTFVITIPFKIDMEKRGRTESKEIRMFHCRTEYPSG